VTLIVDVGLASGDCLVGAVARENYPWGGVRVDATSTRS
jgi:hypothetical protein